MLIARRRAALLASIRAFFSDRDVLEVDTPILSQAGATDPHLDSFTTTLYPEEKTYYLNTSPEFAMKRLLAEGIGAIYQIAKVFRNGERSTRHNPEFTLLEWYRPGYTYHQLISEVEALLSSILPVKRTSIMTYSNAFLEATNCNPFEASLEELRSLIQSHIEADVDRYTRDECLQLIMSLLIEPKFDQEALTFVTDFPASQAMLAQIEGDTAKRFEVYYQHLEIGNGFEELTDSQEQYRRFKADLKQREQNQLPAIPIDMQLIDVLDHMPACSGVAIGIERLLCAKYHCAIQEVIHFPINNV